jgi:hypothetical protein
MVLGLAFPYFGARFPVSGADVPLFWGRGSVVHRADRLRSDNFAQSGKPPWPSRDEMFAEGFGDNLHPNGLNESDFDAFA